MFRHWILQFQEGAKLPTTYAFALVESVQNNRIVLRMYLAGEITNGKTDVTESSSRLLNVRSLITSMNEADRLFYSLKVKQVLINLDVFLLVDFFSRNLSLCRDLTNIISLEIQ